LATAILLQNFNFRLHEPSYTLSIKQTLTLKPANFFMHASLKEGIDSVYLERYLHLDAKNDPKRTTKHSQIRLNPGEAKDPMTVLYGSNSGTCESLAQSLARAAGARGYDVKVNTLDSAVNKVPRGQILVLISPSTYKMTPESSCFHQNLIINVWVFMKHSRSKSDHY
jgi:cytochrome P450/NADPH-cytochrome P450 reductase